ncbi:PIG-L deacetylase family protein [Streptomyces sp. ITFR-16]|uniref:PIG-L deacetylase family protein n=1 Tax=Streptomyces sp. ITFR-16 TaxID=3075198 RepID=UPI002889ED21|nr:PIG-L deacetylase family protein [Streptomyces sp. ITFR-16]WNI20507.1 PIG-L deacetylase family protein [Streptomyces sp. ITFR-16]
MTEPYEPMPEDWQRVLCVVAHPDDLEYGPACAVARWTAQGKFVAYAVVSRGEAGVATMEPAATGAMRVEEQLRAAAVVGVRDVDFLDHPDGTIEYGLPLRRDLARTIRKYRPDVLVTINFHERWRSGDWNSADHRNVGVALLDAANDAGNPWVFPELVEEGFAPWAGVRFLAVGGSPASTHAVDVTDGMKAGIEALAAHAGYLASLPPDNPMADVAGYLTAKHTRFGERFHGVPTMPFEIIGI